MRKRGLGSGFGGLIAPGGAEQGELEYVALTAIVPNPDQPRQRFDDDTLVELADSIRIHGVLQPLVVTRNGAEEYQLIAGERRLRAATLAGLDRVPVVVREVSAQQRIELALIENIQRADLDPIEEARAYAVLEDEFGLTQQEIAKRVGKSRSTVSETLSLLKLPQEVQALVIQGPLTAGHASTLVALRDEALQIAAARHIAEQGLSVRKSEQYVVDQNMRAGKELAPASVRRSSVSPDDVALVRGLEERLGGLRVQLLRSGSGGRVVIYFDNEEMLAGLYDVLQGAS